MAKTSPDLIPGAATGELAHGSLRLWDAIAISVSVLAPGMAMLLNVSGVAAVSGGSTPLAFLLGGVACLALAFVVIGFTRRMASAGYAYTYASRSLGKGAGFMAGWLYFFGMICFVPMTMSGVGYLAADLLGLNPKLWILFFFIGMALLIVLSIIRVKVTTRVQLVVGIVTVAIIVLVDLITTAKGGSHGQAARRVQLRAHRQRRLQRRVLRHHPRRHVLHRLRDRGRLRRGDGQPAQVHPDRRHRRDAVRRRLLPVDHLLHHDRVRRQERGQDRRRPGRAEDRRPPRSSAPGSARWWRSAACCPRSSSASPAPPPARAPCSPWAARTCCPPRSAGPRARFRTPVNATLAVAGIATRDGPADRLPAVRLRVRPAVLELLLLGHHRHAADHRGVHHAVHRRHRVLLEDPRVRGTGTRWCTSRSR